jgi:opacity protein-like surface antigen
MKSFLLAFLLCVSVGIVAAAQDSPNPPPQSHQAGGIQLTSVLGTIQEDGDKLRFVTDQRAWNVDNPETLKGHEGHYVRVIAHLYADKGSIHITEVKMPTASESRKNDVR